MITLKLHGRNLFGKQNYLKEQRVQATPSI